MNTPFLISSEALPSPDCLSASKPVPISKKVDNIKLGHPLSPRSPEKSQIQTRTVIQLSQPAKVGY